MEIAGAVGGGEAEDIPVQGGVGGGGGVGFGAGHGLPEEANDDDLMKGEGWFWLEDLAGGSGIGNLGGVLL